MHAKVEIMEILTWEESSTQITFRVKEFVRLTRLAQFRTKEKRKIKAWRSYLWEELSQQRTLRRSIQGDGGNPGGGGVQKQAKKVNILEGGEL